MRKSLYFFLALALGYEMQATGQNMNEDVVKEKLNASVSTLNKSNFDPSGRSALVNSTSNVSLNSTLNAGVNAKIQAVYHFSPTWSGSIMAQQQLGKMDSTATFYDFSKGISPGTTISLNLQKLFWKPELTSTRRHSWNQLAGAYAKANGVDRRTLTYSDIKDNGTDEEKRVLKEIPLKIPIFVSFSFAMTRTNFSYTTDSVKLKKSTQNIFTPIVKFSVGFPISSSLHSFFSVSYLYSNNYIPGNSATFLTPFGKNGTLVSQTLIFGTPKQKQDHHATIEYRQSFGNEEPSFAIAPTATYGFSSKLLALELPLYFIKGVTGKDKTPSGLQGGIDLGYLTGTDKLTSFNQGFGVQLIVSVPFSVIQNAF